VESETVKLVVKDLLSADNQKKKKKKKKKKKTEIINSTLIVPCN